MGMFSFLPPVVKRPLVYGVRRVRRLLRAVVRFVAAEDGAGVLLLELLLVPVLLLYVRRVRRHPRPIHVGLGPEPLINNLYHKQALIRAGYTAETFVWTDNFISSEYDLNLAQKPWSMLRKGLYLFFHAVRRYQVLFIYFNGGPLFATRILRKLEPRLLKSAGVKVLAMPFGSDVQVMMRSKNLHFKHALAQDYPHHNKNYRRTIENLDRWSFHADFILSGCEWVDYMYHWDMLQIAHFSLDLDRWRPSERARPIAQSGPLRILHAPNHKTLKGTAQLVAAVDRLNAQGLEFELVLLRGVPNSKIREMIEQVDLVADQFVIGWYAMFAIEAMALERPVLCFLRDDLVDLYAKAGLLSPDEIPLINTSVLQIEQNLRWAYEHRPALADVARRGRPYVQRRHSLEAIGGDFKVALTKVGVPPPAREPKERTAVSSARIRGL